MIGMEDRLNQSARGLTADAKQKISLGRGMVREDVNAILFDEPLTVIDPHMKWELRTQLKSLHREFGHTMIYVTHDQTEALTFADKVVVMSEGRVVQLGTPQELFETPAHTFVGYFIGSPGMNLLEAKIDGSTAVVNGVSVPLGAIYGPNTGRTQIGIRPEFARLTAKAACPLRCSASKTLAATAFCAARWPVRCSTLSRPKAVKSPPITPASPLMPIKSTSMPTTGASPEGPSDG